MRSFLLAAPIRLLAFSLSISLGATAAAQPHQHQQAFNLSSNHEIPSSRINFASTSSSSAVATFVGQKVVRFTTLSSAQHQQLLSQANTLGLDVWANKLSAACPRQDEQEEVYGCVDIRLASTDKYDYDSFGPSEGASSSHRVLNLLLQPFASHATPRVTTLIEDLDALVSSQQRSRDSLRSSSSSLLDEEAIMMEGQAWYEDYHTYDEITAYMRMLEKSYPMHAKVIELGKTYEGRPILALKLCENSPPIDPEPPTQPNPEPQPEPEPEPEPPSNPLSSNSTITSSHSSSSFSSAIANASGAKLGIVITGGSHAREWISTSTSLFFASDLLQAALGKPHASPATDAAFVSTSSELNNQEEGEGEDLTAFKRRGKKNRKKKKKSNRKTWTKSSALTTLKTFEITVIPIVNPDGYVYSWHKNRMWRKNRQPNRFPGGLFCKGVDLNRNFGFAFSSSSASSSLYNNNNDQSEELVLTPCSEMYAGAMAFSALETRAIGRYLQDAANNVKGYFDLHSYGQLLMYPFSYDCQETVADEEDLLELSLGAISALKSVHGRQFTTGKICQVYAQGGGNSVDWSYASTELVPNDQQDTSTNDGAGGGGGGGGKNKIKWSYSIELRDGGTYGFLLPKEQIRPAAEEVSAALAYMLNFIAKRDSH
ncbi:related to ECM14 - involved in cell wall biogenesis and architecture [Melanopsichium pennsylvanicum]|uniref:Inactive metallocarboxypeptidase ECM14 n=2 Tax=Melanopsichium pennsylvanicum TaxID=63383 RepID=A0AAJ5C5R8_9BASI|nr:related to ECM14-involved in cell wall biogenesis and architecture [Melanopsichium pennsylvanicum 4]SNX84809.1 related to ECM14 - involved in cell wall biogenesis and architecture [Melanopsichium pennsylvanicum]